MDMNGKWMPFFLTVILVIGVPRLMYGIYSLTAKENAEPAEPTVTTACAGVPTIHVLTEHGMKEMELNEYLIGVLLCEIPGNFHVQAQKAQAVVARTYALRTVNFKDKHNGNAICTDPGCCQGYRDPDEYLSQGGESSRISLARTAVTETDGQVLTYQGALIDATYFSCSGGQTEDALAVWGEDIPYLQSVPSPGEENAEHYWDSVFMTAEEFQDALGETLTGNPNSWFGNTLYTRGGGVAHMWIGGKRYEGTTLRSLLGLRSTAFSVAVTNGMIAITTRGFGHRVGMSQYGAQAMAQSGKEYREILAYYYPGTVIDKEPLIS